MAMTLLYKLSSVFFKNQDKTQDYPLTLKRAVHRENKIRFLKIEPETIILCSI